MSEQNPYASPASVGEVDVSQPVGESMVLATRSERFVNMFIDNIVTQVLSGVAGFVIGMVYASMKIASGNTIGPEDEFTLQLIGMGVGLAIAMAYLIIMEATSQRTVGKLVSGTKVVNEKGGKPTTGQIVGRSFARLIPFEAFSFLSPQRPVGWHDSLSGTRVIKIK